jgi:iron complex outermembrane receptor protein
VPPSRAFGRFAVLLAVLASPLSRAQERPAAGSDGEQQRPAAGSDGEGQRPAAGESIEVAGQRPAAAPEAPAAQATVIETSQFAGEVRSVSEMLLSAPGVSVHSLGGPGQATTLSLRGATADQSLVLLDGIPLQGAGGGAVDLAALPAVLLDRLVVSRGVLGAQYGAGALGGVLELFPRAPREKVAGGAQASFGSFGTAQLAADGEAPVGRAGSALLAVQGDRTQGNFEYARQLTPSVSNAPYYADTRANADAVRGSALARYSTALSPATELDILLQGSAGDRGVPGPWTAPTKRTRQIDEAGLAGLHLRGEAGDAVWSARAWGRLDRIELRGSQIFNDCQDGAPGCPRIDQRSSAARGQGELALPLGAHRLRATLSGGEEWTHGAATGPHRRALFSAALADDWAATTHLSLHPAVRFDQVGKDKGPSPGVAALWKEGPFELRAGFGLSFRAPTFSELYLTSGGVGPNPSLQPERAWSADAGAAWRSGRFTLSAGVFWSQYHDLVIYELHPGASAVTPLNIGSAHLAGLELQAIVPLPAGFLAEAAYSFLDAINDRPGAQQSQKLSYRPPHRLFLRLAHRGDRVEGYAETSFTSRMPRDQYGSAFLPSQLLLNAGAGARVAGPLWLDVEVKNLLADETLEDVFQYPLPGLSIALIARARL